MIKPDEKFKYIYGPVASWRLGRSLGVDAISQKEKQCSFDCVYCQIGRAKPIARRRKIFVPTEDILDELKRLPRVPLDYITFSGMGEPTLAKNIGELIIKIKKLKKQKIAVITNSSLIDNSQVRKEISQADFVMAKLDGSSVESLEDINHPISSVKFKNIVKGLKEFRKQFKGILALQIMFVKKNKAYADKIVLIAREIKADEVQINTPLRKNKCIPLTPQEIKEIKKYFKGLNVITVYEKGRIKVNSLKKTETIKRRGATS